MLLRTRKAQSRVTKDKMFEMFLGRITALISRELVFKFLNLRDRAHFSINGKANFISRLDAF